MNDQFFDVITASPDAWRRFLDAAFRTAGLPEASAISVAEGLLDGELYGHTTHGLALLEPYLGEIQAGRMEVAGDPAVVSETAAVALWDARRLPGIWTTSLAVEAALAKAAVQGVGAIAIRNSHHIGCLAVFLEKAAEAGNIVLIFTSDPAVAHVAPYGATAPIMTPNPIAAGIPTADEPILVDVSTSITTAGNCARARAAGELIAGDWLIAPDGTATRDPNVLQNGGSILPIGGLDHGHKGYGLSLIVEALTQGLTGFGRADAPSGWGASVLVIAFDPRSFGGLAQLKKQTGWLADACRNAKPVDPNRPVRLPGQQALARKRAAQSGGLEVRGEVAKAMRRVAERLQLPLPGQDANNYT